MTTVNAYTEHLDTHIIDNIGRKEFNLLKSVAIYGSNGGGKSNLIQAMNFMKILIFCGECMVKVMNL